MGDRIDLLHWSKLVQLAPKFTYFLDLILIKIICLVSEVPQLSDLIAHLVLYLLTLLNHTPIPLPRSLRGLLALLLLRVVV